MAFLVIQYRMAAVALFLAAACSTMVEQPLLPDDRAYLDNAMAQSLSFTMPTAQANDAWGRAQVFVVKNSDLKIQVATEYVLQTYNPTVDTGTFAYEASRTPRGESTEFTVRCDTPSSETMPRSNRLAHLMAYFVATGRSVPEELLKWCPYAISAGGGPPQGCFERKLF